MLDCELIPVTQDNLDIASKLTFEFGFPRSENWIRRALFNPHVAPCDKSARRGYMLKSKDDGYVGILCYSPMKLYLRDKPLIGYSGLLLGVRKKYGEWLMDLFKAVQEDEKGHLAFGNTSCSAHATRICQLARGDMLGPKECCYSRVAHLGLASGLLSIIRRSPACRFQSFAWRIMYPLRVLDWLFRRLGCKRNFTFVEENDFPSPAFDAFWERYLAGNKGLVSSRDPKILNHLFADALKAGRLVLVTANDCSGVRGYILLRKYALFNVSNVLKYKIVDAIAVDNDMSCLRALVRYAKIYAAGHSGERVEYIGGNPNLKSWIEVELPCTNEFGYNTTTYYYSGDDIDLLSAIEDRSGWFFGPYDGERCLGHSGFIDV